MASTPGLVVKETAKPSNVKVIDRGFGKIAENVARNVRDMRKMRGWSIARFAQECSGRGVRMTWSSLANIERDLGRSPSRKPRQVSVDELFVFAEVFGVSVERLAGTEPCEVCAGQPPTGFVCRSCGAGAFPVDPPSGSSRSIRRRSVTPELLGNVAGVYRRAVADGFAPTVAVAENFGVTRATAARWVREARRGRHLGPSIGTTGGEAA